MSTVSLDGAEAPLVLALDLGTSSFRTLVFDARARAIEGSEEQLQHEPDATGDGGLEADPAALFDLLTRCLDGTMARVGERATDLGAVAASCFWHSLMGVDGQGQATTPLYLWADTRSGPWVHILAKETDPVDLHARTGCLLHSSYWPTKLLWLRDTDPVAFAASARFVSFAEYVAGRLQDDPRVSLSMASGTGLLAVHERVWDRPILDALDIGEDRLPEIMGPGEPHAPLGRAWADRWPALAGIPWFPADGDGACANVGSGAVHPGRVALTMGTSGAVRVVLGAGDGPLAVPSGLWTYRLDDRHYVAGGALSNGGNLLAWLVETLDVQWDDETMRAAAAIPPDGHGLTILPFLAGERAPGWNDATTGVIAGMRLATRPEDILRAGMEAVAYRFARVYRAVRSLASPDHEIVTNGGAILRSPLWLQIMADVLGHDLRTLPPDTEASGRGATILALVTIGHLPGPGAAPDPSEGEPVTHWDPEAHGRYARAIARQGHLDALLFPEGTTWQAAYPAG
ncbi:MAG: Gluconokinase [uncultured Thermomicrobiales bacterium]|uniref:Gluconokinase n=1 Tax=uncultured Thermomicrobiales bacterium TaxID=1645740 RepID=A0A6J4ULV6_9BACT|nr:MAG: Gluconokinase [uncultured Thermomicrobiales bacterium]